jgi:hypothetical protein
MSRCRFCHHTGHNQRTCPTKTKRMKERADAAIARGDHNAWAVQEYNKRVGPKKGKKVSSQQCGYCSDYGHTRRNCSVLEKDKVFYAKHHNMVVKVCHDYITSSPIGIGSLFSQTRDQWCSERSGYFTKKHLCVAVGFEVHTELLTNNPKPILVLQRISDGVTICTDLRCHVLDDGTNTYYLKTELIATEAQPVPSGWIEKHSTNVAALAKHFYFHRTGKSQKDRREWTLRSMEQWKEMAANPDSYSHQSAVYELKLWSEDSIRSKMFADFKKDV